MSIKIGDFVKLKEWKEFLEVTDVEGYIPVRIRITEGDASSWYDVSLGFVKQGDEDMKNEQQKQDEFQVGDVVYCTAYGKGEVTKIDDDVYCVCVEFPSGNTIYYRRDGKLTADGMRTLFFSEPKIEAAVTRPFVSTLVGKKVVVESQLLGLLMACTITGETQTIVDVIDESGDNYHWQKEDISAIYEVQSENLLKK